MRGAGADDVGRTAEDGLPHLPTAENVWSLASLRRFDASVRASAREAARQFQPDVILAVGYRGMVRSAIGA